MVTTYGSLSFTQMKRFVVVISAMERLIYAVAVLEITNINIYLLFF